MLIIPKLSPPDGTIGRVPLISHNQNLDGKSLDYFAYLKCHSNLFLNQFFYNDFSNFFPIGPVLNFTTEKWREYFSKQPRDYKEQFFQQKYLWRYVIQGNQGDMQKIHMTWQFFETSGSHGHYIEKTKKPVFR